MWLPPDQAERDVRPSGSVPMIANTLALPQGAVHRATGRSDLLGIGDRAPNIFLSRLLPGEVAGISFRSGPRHNVRVHDIGKGRSPVASGVGCGTPVPTNAGCRLGARWRGREKSLR